MTTADDLLDKCPSPREVFAHVHKLDDYIDLHASPPDYTEWNNIAKFLVDYTSFRAPQGGKAESPTTQGEACSCVTMLRLKAPPRYLSREMLEFFRQTEPPPLTPEMMDVFPSFIVVLPKHAYDIYDLPVQKDGYLSFVGVCPLSYLYYLNSWFVAQAKGVDVDDEEIILKVKESARRKDRGVGLFGVTSLGSCFMLSAFLEDNRPRWEKFDALKEEIKIIAAESKQFRSFEQINKSVDQMLGVVDLVLNVLGVYTYEPELIERDPAPGRPVTRGRGFAASVRTPAPPVWIGRSKYLEPSPDCDDSPHPASRVGTGIKVRPHWRKGHWHHFPCGSGRRDRRLRWVRPVFVGAKQPA
jgi:hypothetical protein